ncbi:MAG: YlbF family regulator [Lachnospira sp.]|nr:YlbF family regulator [Lachnospira sp.]
MNKIENLKLELTKAIRESQEYKEYREFSEVLSRQPDLKRAVDEFRKENFLYQNSHDIEDPLGASLALDARFADVRSQEVVNRYLMAEMGVCRLVRDVCMSVVEAVDFDMEFLQ